METAEYTPELRRFHAGEGDSFETRSGGLKVPVHIQGSVAGFAPAKWSLHHLDRLAGNCQFRVSRNDENGKWIANKDGRCGIDWFELSLSEYLAGLANGELEKLYAGSISIDQLPPLRDEAMEAPFLAWIEDPGSIQIRFWLGRGNATQLHYDLFYTFLAPIIGEREVWLYAPTHLEDFYPRHDANNRNVSTIGSPKTFDRSTFSAFCSKRPIELTIKPGEVLFIPIYWWHYVEARPEVNVALSYHFVRPTVETLRSEYLLHCARGRAGLA